MKQVNTSRTVISQSFGIYFGYLTDQEIQDLITACEAELELRSQAEIKIGDSDD